MSAKLIFLASAFILTQCDTNKKIPDELTELKSLKKLNISGLNIRTLPENFTELKNLMKEV